MLNSILNRSSQIYTKWIADASTRDWQDTALFGVSFILIVLLVGSVPGLLLPSMGQIIWLGGFAESMANGFPVALTATDFGIPAPAAISFGLTGALPMAIFIKLGVPMPLAYSLVISIWLGIAFLFSCKLAMKLGNSRRASILIGLVWMSLPMIWGHASYSMLVIGFALLPAYAYAAVVVLDHSISARESLPLFLLVCVVSIFTDGYTFVMFAVCFAALFLAHLTRESKARHHLLYVSAPAGFTGLLGAYLLFSLYTGRSEYPSASLNFFRGWGADITYMLQPTKGILAISDVFGLSAERLDREHFGDASVYRGTFLVPLLIAAVWAFFRSGSSRLKYGLIGATVFSFYFSLGPSLKVAEKRPDQVARGMTVEQAGLSTGTGFISKNVPGFKNMRASYRWIALTQFGLWGMFAIGFAAGSANKRKIIYSALPLGLIAANIPPPAKHLSAKAKHYQSIQSFESDLSFLGEALSGRSRVLFYPTGNDFSVNYLAPKFGFQTYNIGGDKNVAIARKGWPTELLSIDAEKSLVSQFDRLFEDGKVDAIVIPKFNLLVGAHVWPAPEVDHPFLEPLRSGLLPDGSYSFAENEFAIVLTKSE